ncbi:hypothetical protein J4410_02175 [Candidatus Woesearchaeota archaeon]|nr:hypothetical protein [Candidatus Woesearchaeota archaeon]
MAYTGNIGQVLTNIGLQDLWLPFALFFVLSFVALQKSGVLGHKDEDAKKYNIVISLVISLLVVVPHIMGVYPPNSDPVNIVNAAIPNVAILLVAIVMFLILIGLFAGKSGWTESMSGFIVLISFIAIIWIFLRAAGYAQYGGAFWSFLDNSEVQAVIVIILIFTLIVWFVTKEPGEGHFGDGIKSFFEGLGKGGHGGH